MDALIGHSGFVGSSLARQRGFERCYRSTDIQDIRGESFDLVICAGAPAQKWIANKNPAEDQRNIDALIGHLRATRCATMVLISTVDVFASPIGVTEASPPEMDGLHAYGRNRRRLEVAVQETFARHLVVRPAGSVPRPIFSLSPIGLFASCLAPSRLMSLLLISPARRRQVKQKTHRQVLRRWVGNFCYWFSCFSTRPKRSWPA